MESLLKRLTRDYPRLTFRASDQFRWSPVHHEILYDASATGSPAAVWSLLHEVGHALLNHRDYESDIELVTLEAAAWDKAVQIGQQYGHEIDDEHIQDCLDTYRDWLHQRSACPACDNRSLQQDSRHYKCFNCGQTWSVSTSRFCRPYRLTSKTKTSPPKHKATLA